MDGSSYGLAVLIEKPVAVTYCQHEIVGRVDAISDGRILELKTGARAWSQDQADHDIQLTAYAWLAVANGIIDGAEGVRAAIVCATPRKVSVIETVRTATDIARLQVRVVAVAQAMERDVYPPAVDGWWHHPEYCEYWYECPHAGGTPATGDGHGHIWD